MNDTKIKIKQIRQGNEIYRPSILEDLLELLNDKEVYRP